MKIFDSLKNKRWSGRGVEIRSSSILALKSANFTHPINIRAGKYVLKIMGKKRTGSGKITVEILSDQNEIFLNKDINFTNNSWSEVTFTFDSNKNFGPGKIRFTRDRNVYGSIEIGRIYIDLLNDLPAPQKSSVASRRARRIRNTNFATRAPDRSLVGLDAKIKKKIAFIVPYHIYGGAEVYIQNIINNLDGYPITILYMKANNLQNNITNSKVTHRVIKNPAQLEGILKSNEYDFVVYYNRADIYTLLTKMKSAGGMKSKLIEIYHSDFMWAGSLSSIKKRVGVDKLISISKSLALDISGISGAKRSVVPVGIDLNKFSSKRVGNLKIELGISESKTVIGTVARLSKEKAVSYIIDLAEKAPDMEFVIVGDGPEKYSLAKKVLDLNLNNVHMVGHKKNVEDYYSIFDGFVLASKIEGTPISIIEAMASEVPIFTNMVGAIPDLITDGETGFKIVGNPIIDLKTIRGGLNNLPVTEAARQYVVENHDIDRMHIKFLDSLITLDSFFAKKKYDDALILPGEYI